MLLTSSSNPNAPRLLPMPPDADVDIGTLDGSGINFSLILLKNDMIDNGVKRDALREGREQMYYGEWKGCCTRKACAAGRDLWAREEGAGGAVLEDRGKSRKLGKPHIINCRAFTVIVTVRRSNVNSAGGGERARIRR